jgi:hypothetical protein
MKTSIYSQHHDHTGWLNKLTFYNDEIVVMQKRLEEVNSKNTSVEVRKSVEHFQNQLIIQKNNSDDLCHHIRREEKELLGNIKKNPVAVDHRKTEDHTEERDMLESFEKNFNELRTEFNTFLSKTL